MTDLNKAHRLEDCEEDVALSECSGQVPEATEKEADKNNFCPLFMDGLPRDFSTNPSLAAIASLLDEEDEKLNVEGNECKALPANRGGGKVRRTPMRSKRKEGQPYESQKREDDTKKTSVGEAHLFLKMWKL